MNFKRNYLKIITLVGSVFLIAGCQDSGAFVQYQNIEEVVDTHEEFVASDGSYEKHGNFASYTAKLDSTHTKDFGNTYNVLTEFTGRNILEATGDRKILVVPVQFSDFTIQTLGVKPEEYISNLNKAFFGASKSNKYVSVAEYYNRSSYGKLRISGKVCPKIFPCRIF